MELYTLSQKPPAIHIHSGGTQSGHIMWLRGEPFVSWNCAAGCNQRLRQSIKEASEQHTCEHCGAVYAISMSYAGIDIRQCPTLH